MFLAFFPLCPFVCLVVEKRFPLQTVDPILRKPSRRSRAFLKSVEFIFFPLIHANPSTRSGQVYANFETIREDWRRHLHVRHTVPDGLCQGGARVSGINFDFKKALSALLWL
jgi:hypothetical protein